LLVSIASKSFLLKSVMKAVPVYFFLSVLSYSLNLEYCDSKSMFC
jgi:hypothetical protein